MSYLLQISLGPVQGFIAASRKTRDLKAGSQILQTISSRVAKSVEAAGGELIFPADVDAPAANIILAKVDGDPGAIAEAARKEASEHLSSAILETVRKSVAGQLGEVDEALAASQAEQFLEWFAAWTPLEPGKYGQARARVGQLLAARKGLRDFHAPRSDAGRPKSPLDPRFDTILNTVDRTFQLSQKLLDRTPALKPKEVLDAISFYKRFGGDFSEMRFPSVRSVAVASILSQAGSLADELSACLEGTGFDAGDALFDAITDKELAEQTADLRKRILKEGNAGRPPSPYYAVIHGDGDSMGAFLDSLEDLDGHRKFSGQLSKFSRRVAEIVEDLDGIAIYAGGDDVVALCPVPQALAIASQLREAFAEAMASLPGPKPTLTIGIGISHVMDGLQRAVGWAKELETFGKSEPGKNALAVGVQTRSGGATKFRLSWDRSPDKAMEAIREAFERNEISRGFPFEIRRLADEAKLVAQVDDVGPDEVKSLIRGEFRRILGRKRPAGNRSELELPDWADTPEGLENYAGMLVVAHFMTRSREEANV
jgi:CRISPR-associated protein Cmr2